MGVKNSVLLSSGPIPAAVPAIPESDPYLVWLSRTGESIFWAGDTAWRLYRLGTPWRPNILVPASAKPQPIDISLQESQSLLEQSCSLFLRWFSQTFAEPTDFWYILCDRYDFDALPGKMKTKIRRSQKDCVVRQVDAAWMLANAYPCYLAAYSKHKNSVPYSQSEFGKNICVSGVDGPFAFWGAFVRDTLAAFAKLIVGNDYVTMVVFKVHPDYSASRPAYALLHEILDHYVKNESKPLNNGFRSLHHQTNMQEFLLQFGFRPVYSDLKLVYTPLASLAIRTLYPFRTWLDRIPASRIVAPLRSLVMQEQVSRTFRDSPGKRPAVGSAH